jgi:hypothetical protein
MRVLPALLLFAATARAQQPSLEELPLAPAELPGRWTAADHRCTSEVDGGNANVYARVYGAGALLDPQPLIDLAMRLALDQYREFPLRVRTPKKSELTAFSTGTPQCVVARKAGGGLRILNCFYHAPGADKFYQVEYEELFTKGSDAQFARRANAVHRAAAAQFGYR